MCLDPLGDPIHSLTIDLPAAVQFVVHIKRHVVEPGERVGVRITEWPSIVPPLANPRKCFGGMIIDIPRHDHAVQPTAVIEGIGNLVSIVDGDPQLVGARKNAEAFGVPQPFGEKLWIGPVG